MPQKMKLERVDLDSEYTIEELIDKLQQLVNTHPHITLKSHVEVSSYEEYGSSYTEFYVEYRRPETAEETEKREAEEAVMVNYRRNYELKQYEELKKKFEGK